MRFHKAEVGHRSKAGRTDAATAAASGRVVGGGKFASVAAGAHASLA